MTKRSYLQYCRAPQGPMITSITHVFELKVIIMTIGNILTFFEISIIVLVRN